MLPDNPDSVAGGKHGLEQEWFCVIANTGYTFTGYTLRRIKEYA